MKLLGLTLLLAATFLDRSYAGDTTCDFPILDEPSQASREVCAEINSEKYQKKILDYICSSSCNDLQLCLDNFKKLKLDPQISTTIARVEKTTLLYSKDRKLEKCGNYDPQPPVDAADQSTWDNFKEFVEARRSMNHLLKAKLASVKNQCIRRDNTAGAYMRFKRTTRYGELLGQCRNLDHPVDHGVNHAADRATGSLP